MRRDLGSNLINPFLLIIIIIIIYFIHFIYLFIFLNKSSQEWNLKLDEFLL